MSEGTASETTASTPAEYAAQIRSLRHRLTVLERQNERYRHHYGELESVCWEVLTDVQELRTAAAAAADAGLNESHRTDQSLIDAAAASAERTTTTSALATSSSTADREKAQALSSRPMEPSRTPLRPFEACPRPRGSLHLQRNEAQALMDRLWTLRAWVGDLADAVGGRASNNGAAVTLLGAAPERENANFPIAEAAPAAALRRQPAHAVRTLSASPSPQQRTKDHDTHDQLHRLLDDVFLGFTQLQATLTDTLWSINHPPALSTPPHTRQDRDMEVARLRTINDQLRRTLQGYEQAHRRTDARVPVVHGDVRRTQQQQQRRERPSTSSPQPPPGYTTVASDAGLYVAQ